MFYGLDQEKWKRTFGNQPTSQTLPISTVPGWANFPFFMLGYAGGSWAEAQGPVLMESLPA